MAISTTHRASAFGLDPGARLRQPVQALARWLQRCQEQRTQRLGREQARRDAMQVRGLAQRVRRTHPGLAADLDAAVDRMTAPGSA